MKNLYNTLFSICLLVCPLVLNSQIEYRCNNITDSILWNFENGGEFAAGDTLGWGEYGLESVVVKQGHGYVNNSQFGEWGKGISMGSASVNFDFSDDVDPVRFEVFCSNFYPQQFGIGVNGEPCHYFNSDQEFPFDFGDVTVDIDTSPPDGSCRVDYYTFTGNIDDITFCVVEGNIWEVCTVQNATANQDVSYNSDLDIWPNPNQGRFTIESELFIESIKLYSPRAQLQNCTIEIEGTKAELTMNDQISGIYFAQIVLADGSIRNEKLIVSGN